MAQIFMPTCKVGSPVAVLTGPITASSTYIPFNTAILPAEAEGICSVGTELDFETIHYTSKDAGGVYTTNGGHRGYDGTTAKSWAAGTQVGRFISNYDMYAMRNNIVDHETRLGSHAHTGGAGGQIDHGGLAGLGDNDHTQYAKIAGETFTGAVNLAGSGYNGLGGLVPYFSTNVASAPIQLSLIDQNRRGALMCTWAISGAKDTLYMAHRKSEWTITESTTVSGSSALINGFNNNLGADVLIDVTAHLPYVLTMDHGAVSISASDTMMLVLVSHRGEANTGTLTAWKVEYKIANGSWVTVLDRTGATDRGTLAIPLYYRTGDPQYTNIYGVRLTITGATAAPYGNNNFYLGRIMLLNTRGVVGGAEGMGALDQAGGDMYGDVDWKYGVPKVAGVGLSLSTHNHVLDTLTAPTDVTTNNATTSLHGLLLKATAAASGNRNVVAIDNGETTYKCTALFDATNPAALGTAGPGTSLFVARRDHVHPMPSDGNISNWTVGPTPTRVSDSSFTVTDNATNQAIFAPGRPIRYTDSTAYRYGIVVGYSSGTVTLAGGAMTTSYDAIVEYADFNRVVRMEVFIGGAYGDADNTALIASDLKSSKEWRLGPAYLVNVRLKSNTIDSPGADGYVNVLLGGAPICTATTTFGIMMNSTAWKDSAVAVDVTNYSTTFGDAIEIAAYKGYTGNAADLTVVMLFVLV